VSELLPIPKCVQPDAAALTHSPVPVLVQLVRLLAHQSAMAWVRDQASRPHDPATPSDRTDPHEPTPAPFRRSKEAGR
jgi:hypothetical protein